ncbi:putative leader peptide [Saccharopolyspora flava]|uniref:putative leader peptide n=1 Tax=Saccharopolyspora flava TaxID=95161 RepID=UPI003CCBC352
MYWHTSGVAHGVQAACQVPLPAPPSKTSCSTRPVPLYERSSRRSVYPGNLPGVHVLLTRRRAVDLCRVGSSLC